MTSVLWNGTVKPKTYDGTRVVAQRYCANIMNLDDLINFFEDSFTFDTMKKTISVEQRMHWVNLLIQNEMKSVIIDLTFQIDAFSFKCVECGKLYSGLHGRNREGNPAVTIFIDSPEDVCTCIVERLEDVCRYITNECADLLNWVEMAKV